MVNEESRGTDTILIERWAVSRSERAFLNRLTSVDELVATWTETDNNGSDLGGPFEIIVLRNGFVTDRNADGSIGVPEYVRELISDEDTLYHPIANSFYEETEAWVDVAVSSDGRFLRLLD